MCTVLLPPGVNLIAVSKSSLCIELLNNTTECHMSKRRNNERR